MGAVHQRRYKATDKGRATQAKWRAGWREKNRPKARAHIAVCRAIQSGLLKRGKCEKCGSKNVQAHHDDYSRPLDVRWLCPSDHQKEKSGKNGKTKMSEQNQKENGNRHVGRPTKYPGKRRDKPVQIALSDEGLEALEAGIVRTGHSKAVYIEMLIRQEDAKHRRPAGYARQ